MNTPAESQNAQPTGQDVIAQPCQATEQANGQPVSAAVVEEQSAAPTAEEPTEAKAAEVKSEPKNLDLTIDVQVSLTTADGHSVVIPHQQLIPAALHPDFAPLVPGKLTDVFRVLEENTRIKYLTIFAPPPRPTEAMNGDGPLASSFEAVDYT
jgi:hypothetical protein